MFSKNGRDPGQAAVSQGTGRAPYSLATRLTLWYTASSFALILVASGFLYWALVAGLDRAKDHFLADQARILRGLLLERPDEPNAILQEVEWESASRQYAAMFVRILDETGQTNLETTGMGKLLPRDVFPAPADIDATPGQGVDLQALDGRTFRAMVARANGGPGGSVQRVLQVAVDRTHEDEILAEYQRYFWIILSLALFACALGGYLLARRGLRPVAAITRTAGRIRSSTLDQRLSVLGLPAELASLAHTFNEMLDRLEESFARLSRFSADIAHELRTPVNNLRGEAEVILGKPRSAEEYRDALGSCLEEYARLSRMIDSVLFLARAEHHEAPVARERVKIGQELTVLREFYEAAAQEARITLTVCCDEDLTASLDRTLFQRAVGNLIENALTHTQSAGTITLGGYHQGADVRVVVSDSGRGIPPEHLPHIFDRFYRADRARSSATGGVGLGLAIVKSIVELHGGSVAVSSKFGLGTQVTLTFPATSGQMTNS